MLTLWDLLKPIIPCKPKQASPSVTSPERERAGVFHSNGVAARRPAGPPATPHLSGTLTPASNGTGTAGLSPARSANPGIPSGKAPRKLRVKPSAQSRYESIARDMLARYGIKVRKWRSGTSGLAWEIRYTDGSVKRFLESPRPKGPMSMAVFLHEVGHHAVGFRVYKPRCLEEYHVWVWALQQMEAHGLTVTDSVRRRMHNSLVYAVAKARRRGLRHVPPALAQYTTRIPRARALRSE